MTVARPKRLWHYTCSHGIDGIIAAGAVRPHPGPMHQPAASSYARSIGVDMDVVALPVVWLTDIDVRSRDDAELIGLGGSPIAVCNRIEYRFRVPGSPSIRPWGEWADERLPELVEGDVWRTLIELERAPARWWVSEDPIPGVRLDERYRPWTT